MSNYKRRYNTKQSYTSISSSRLAYSILLYPIQSFHFSIVFVPIPYNMYYPIRSHSTFFDATAHSMLSSLSSMPYSILLHLSVLCYAVPYPIVYHIIFYFQWLFLPCIFIGGDLAPSLGGLKEISGTKIFQ